jgi:hypothetical protein
MNMASSMMAQPEMASMVSQLAGQMFSGGGGGGDGNPLAGLGGLMSGILGGAGRAGGASSSATSNPPRQETAPTSATTGATEEAKESGKEKELHEEDKETGMEEEDPADLDSLMQQLPPDFITRVMNPVEFQKILDNEEIISLENDVKFGPIIKELRAQGPFALMGYLGDPDVIRLLGRLAKKVFGDEAQDEKSEKSPSYFS